MIDQAVIKISFLDRKRNQRGLNPMQKWPKTRNPSAVCIARSPLHSQKG
jgi:hypothetical protein